MNTQTLTKPQAPVLPELDRPDAEEIGDEILLEAAANVKVGKVHAGARTANQSADSRAWTSRGRVD